MSTVDPPITTSERIRGKTFDDLVTQLAEAKQRHRRAQAALYSAEDEEGEANLALQKAQNDIKAFANMKADEQT